MLYNPEWQNTTTKPGVFSLEGLIAWLEMQPANRTYNYHDCEGSCLIDLYLGKRTTYAEYKEIANQNDFGLIAARKPHTFGAALDRARAALTAAGAPHER